MERRSSRRQQRSTLSDALTSNAADSWSPFHAAALDYFKAGYLPIPLPANKKWPPPKGVPNEIAYDENTLRAWLSGEYQYGDTIRRDTRPKNIGSIVPDGLVVFDIDGKPGMESLKELEGRLGPLPRTWVSFRGEPDRYHLWFATPNGMTWPGKLGAGLDVIYRHYRYMVMPPSLHPSGNQYRWASLREGELADSLSYFPAPDEHTDLPEAWLALGGRNGYVRRDRADVDARLWLREHGTGEPCAEMARVYRQHQRLIRKHADLGGMHDALINACWAICAEIAVGHVGGYTALSLIKETFLLQADGSGRRKNTEAEEEWQRAIIGAIEKTALEPVRVGDPCIVEEDERGKDPNRFFDSKYGLKSRTLRMAVERTGKLAVGPGKIIYRYTNGLWTPDGESEIYRRATRLLGQRYRPSHAANVLSVVANREPRITDDSQDTRYLNLPNGFLDWRESKLYPHSPAIISTTRLPIAWNEDAECPDIDGWLNEVCPPDAVELAYEILGYMLYNGNPLHKAILLYGSGRNGKGTFIRLARMLVGSNNISAVTPQALDSSQFSSAQLYGKLANLVGDVDPRIFKSTEQFKQLTGGDTMMGQHKHRDPFYFICRALMIAAFNSLPRTADTTEGFFSRWVVVPFTAFFPAGVADPMLLERLTRPSELQGLLRMAVGGLQNVMRRGAFSDPDSVRKATQRFREEADPVRGFIRERIKRETNSFTPRTEVYNSYVAWSTVNGYSPLSATRLYESLNAAIVGIGIRPYVKDGTRGYKHLTIE